MLRGSLASFSTQNKGAIGRITRPFVLPLAIAKISFFSILGSTMSVRMRHTHEHTANRRSHHALKEPRLSTCKDCNAKHLRHHMCDNCGKYKGRQVVDVAAKAQKKAERIAAKKKSYGEEVDTKGHTEVADESTVDTEVEPKTAKKATPKAKGTNVETKKEDK